MGIAMSILVFAVGAILRFAVTVTTNGFDLHMIGVILMFAGAVGGVFSVIYWSTWGGFNREVPVVEHGGDVIVKT